MQFIVKLFPEITIKSPPVRRQMVRQLAQNIRRILRRIDPSVQVVGEWDRVRVQADPAQPQPALVQALACIPGIASFLEVVEFPLGGLDALAEQVLALHGAALDGRSFAVRCRRNGPDHHFTSQDVERHVGRVLLERSAARGVDLRRPDVLVRLEIRGQQVLVVRARHAGLGGFPLGSVDAVLSLMSGGFDSAVASFLAMRRGLCSHFVFFSLGGSAHELAVKEVALYLWLRYGSSHRVLFVTVPFEPVVAEILDKVSDSQMGVVLKRCMLRAASRIAAELEIPALLTGESVAQVSSQTLANLAVIDQVTDTLVLRPLIAMDKGEIIDIARRIGSEPFSRHMPEYCGIISRQPTTRARLARIESEESRIDSAVFEQAIAARRMVSMHRLAADRPAEVSISEVAVPAAGDVVIDLRHPADRTGPLPGVNAGQVLAIPFYELQQRFTDLPTGPRYLLYCQHGVMSRLHAGHLLAQGVSAIGVYRPHGQADAA